jgi:outer membrane phospholipase A
VPPAHQKKIAHVLEKWSVFPMFVSFFWIFMNLYDNYGQTDQWFSIHKSIRNSPLRELHCDP